MPKYAIVTPYYKEQKDELARCLLSVRQQTVACHHILVADGIAQDWFDGGENIRHIRLSRNHADCGGTPRAIGAEWAADNGYDAIGFLDADNWLQTDHIERCLSTVATVAVRPDYIVANMRLCRRDGSELPILQESEEYFIDTSRFLLLPTCYRAIQLWRSQPRELSPIGDRIFSWALRRARFRGLIIGAPPTVNYLNKWRMYYEALGEPVPPGAKPAIGDKVILWLSSLSRVELAQVASAVGLSPSGVIAVANLSRKMLKDIQYCPCGSSIKYRDCCGVRDLLSYG